MLPSEMVAEILKATLDDRPGEVRIFDGTLSAVCKLLFELILATPEMWTDVHIDVQFMTAAAEDRAFSWAAEQLKQAKGALLRIYFSCGHSGDGGRFLKLLGTTSVRWLEATFVVPAELISLLAPIRGRIPELRYLAIEIVVWSDWFDVEPTLAAYDTQPFEIAPTLRALSLKNCGNILFPFAQIQLLFGHYSAHVRDKVLPHTANVEDIRFSPISGLSASAFMPPSGNPLTFPCLRRISPPSVEFMKAVIVPALEELTLFQVPAIPSLEIFMAQSPWPKLKTLTVTDYKPPLVDGLPAILAACPDITSVGICVELFSQTILRRLAEVPGQQMIGVNMQHLTVVIHRPDRTSQDDLLDMVGQRMAMAAGDGGCAPLRSLTVTLSALSKRGLMRLENFKKAGLTVSSVPTGHSWFEDAQGKCWAAPMLHPRLYSMI